MIYLTCWLSQGLSRSGLDPKLQTAIVFVWFLFNALRSRVFSPMDASRPKMAEERTAIRERKRPSWMPPPLAFPIIWSTIALLRAGSTAVVFGALGGTLNHPAVFAMLTHLAVGDTWNAINNVERRLGTACLGVACVLASVYAVVAKYYAVAPKAGVMIAPSAVWISVATVLVWTIWKINPGEDGEREPLLPTKEIAA
jgi:tryptophan-rich sensory protein